MKQHVYAVSEVIKRVVAGVNVPDTTPNYSPIEPQVAPDGASPFNDEVSEQIATTYKDQALLADTFESFQNLLVKIATDLSLEVASDLPKIASILNKIRVRSEKDPI